MSGSNKTYQYNWEIVSSGRRKKYGWRSILTKIQTVVTLYGGVHSQFQWNSLRVKQNGESPQNRKRKDGRKYHSTAVTYPPTKENNLGENTETD